MTHDRATSDRDAAIGAAIRAARLAAGLTQDDLAQQLGYAHRSALTRIESGERGLKAVDLLVIARHLNLDLNRMAQVIGVD